MYLLIPAGIKRVPSMQASISLSRHQLQGRSFQYFFIFGGCSVLTTRKLTSYQCKFNCGNCGRLANKILAYEVRMICPKLIAVCKIHCKSPSRWPDGRTTLNWFTVHEANLSAYIRESAYVWSHVGCGRVHQTLLLHVPQIFKRRKSDANKQNFQIKLNLTYRARSTPKTIGIFTKVFCTFGPNLVILAWTGDELSRGQALNGVNFDFEVKFDLKGQGQSAPKTTGILTKVIYTYDSNLVILAWMGDGLSRRQASVYRTHRRTEGRTHRQTDAGNDNTRRPKLAFGKDPTPTEVAIKKNACSSITVPCWGYWSWCSQPERIFMSLKTSEVLH